MNHRDIAVLMDGIAPVLRGYVEKAFGPIVARLAALESRAAPAGEKGEPGKDGEPGAPGRDGVDGKDGLSGKDGRDGSDGLPGKDGAAGAPGSDGIDGKDGAPGRDGRDGLPGVQGEKGFDGKDGRDGVDGKDGFGLDDFDVKSDDDGRTLVFSFKREGREPIVRTVKTAIVLDRGVWRERSFEKGDSVTWAGSSWIAQRDTADKPETSDAWRLAVKRGRDGRDGKTGERGAPGQDGRAGKDLTQMAPDGSKW